MSVIPDTFDPQELAKSLMGEPDHAAVANELMGSPVARHPYDDLIEESTARHGVDPDLVRAQMGQESSFKPGARSNKGASGLMQLMPDTARSLGVTNIYDPKQNIDAGVKYLRQQLDEFGTVPKALAAYNAGPGAVRKYGDVPPYKETRGYVQKITSKYQGNGYRFDPNAVAQSLMGEPDVDHEALARELMGESQPEKQMLAPGEPLAADPVADISQPDTLPDVSRIQPVVAQEPTPEERIAENAAHARGVQPVPSRPVLNNVDPTKLFGGAAKVAPKAQRAINTGQVIEPATQSREPVIGDLPDETQQVKESDTGNAVAEAIKPPDDLNADQAGEYVRKQLQAKYPTGDFSKFTWLGERRPGSPVAITYNDLKNAGIDTAPIVHEKTVQQQTANPAPSLNLKAPANLPTASEFADQILGDRDKDNQLTKERAAEIAYANDAPESDEETANLIKATLLSGPKTPYGAAQPSGEAQAGALNAVGGLVADVSQFLGGGLHYAEKVDPILALSDHLFGQKTSAIVGRFGNRIEKITDASTPDTGVYRLYGTVGQVGGKLPSYAIATVASGGNPILGFAVHDALVAKGKGGSTLDTIKGGGQGLFMGAALGTTGALGKMAADGLLGESLASAVNGVENPTATVLRTAIEKGVPVGSAASIGYGSAAAEGADEKERWKSAVLFGAMEFVGSMLHKKPGETLSPDEISQADGTVIRVPDDKGQPHTVLLTKDNDQIAVTDVSNTIKDPINGVVLPNRDARRATTEVPETPAEPESKQYTSVLDEIRQRGLNTKAAIQDAFPQLSRQEAGDLRRQAWENGAVSPQVVPDALPAPEEADPNTRPPTISQPEPPPVTASEPVLAHPDERLNGKPILTTTGDGRVVVQNADNATGISVVKPDRGSPKVEAEPAEVPEESADTLPPQANNEAASSLQNKFIDTEREKRGLPPITKAFKQSWGDAAKSAMGRLDENPNAGADLVAELSKHSRAIDATEGALIDHQELLTRQRYDDAVDAVNKASEANDGAARAEAEGRLAKASDDLLEIHRVSKEAGTHGGRGLNFRKAMLKEDFSLASLERQKRAANGGRQLTEDERTELTRVADDYKAKSETLEGLLKDRESRIAQMQNELTLKDLQHVAAAPHILKVAEDIVNKLNSRADAARKRLDKRGATFTAGIDPVALKDLAEIGASHIAQAGLDFAKWSDRMASEFGEKIKPHLQKIYEEANKLIENFGGKGAVGLRDPEARNKAALEALKTRYQNQIDEFEKALRENQAIERPGRGRTVLDAKAETLRTRRNELRDQYNAVFGVKGLTDEQRLEMWKKRTQGRIAELQGALDSGTKITKQSKPLPIDKESTELQEQKGALQDRYDEQFPQPPLTDEQRLKNWKSRAQTRLVNLTERVANKDFSPPPKRTPVPLDRDALSIQAELAHMKQEFQRGLIQDSMARRGGIEKVADFAAKWRRMSLLSSPKTLIKLLAAGASRIPTNILEQVAEQVPAWLMPRLVQQAERAAGVHVTAEAKAVVGFFTQGLKDAAKVLKSGSTDIKSVFGHPDLYPQSVMEFFGKLHQAEKAPVVRAAFERSLELQAINAIQNGLDVSDPIWQMQAGHRAYRAAERDIFMEQNSLVTKYRLAIRARPDSTGKIPLSSKATETIANIMLPVVKIPLNYVKQTGTAISGLPEGLVRAGFAYKRGIENLQPDEAELILRHLRKGAVGAGFVAWGFLQPQTFGGYYDGGKRKDDEPQFGGIRVAGRNLPRWLTHNPFLEAAQFGATMRHVMDEKLHKSDLAPQGWSAGLKAAVLGLVEEAPFVSEMKNMASMLNAHDKTDAVGKFAGSFVPQLIKTVAEQADTTPHKSWWDGDVVKRKPEGVVENVMVNIPLARRYVPTAADTLDKKGMTPQTYAESSTRRQPSSIAEQIAQERSVGNDTAVLDEALRQRTQELQDDEKLTEKDARRANEILGLTGDKAFKPTSIKPDAPDEGESFPSEQGFLDRLGVIADALETDPADAFKKWWGGEYILGSRGGAVMVRRMDMETSQALRKKMGANAKLTLDHKIPLSLGGSNDVSNLELVDKDQAETDDGAERSLAKALKEGKVTALQAQRLIMDFKAKWIGPKELANQLGISEAEIAPESNAAPKQHKTTYPKLTMPRLPRIKL